MGDIFGAPLAIEGLMGTLFELFNPFALLCGLVSVAMITMDGAAWLACKTEEPVRGRAQRAGAVAAVAVAALFALGGVWASHLDGYVLQHFRGVSGPSNPLGDQVARQAGALMTNYGVVRFAVAAPIVGLGSAVLAGLLLAIGRLRGLAFVCSGFALPG